MRACAPMKRMLSLANGRSELSDSFSGFPVWLVSISPSRCTSLSSASASLSSRALRSPGVSRDHFLNAWRAAFTARSTSSAAPFGTLPTVFSVAGSITLIRCRDEDSTSLPSMIIFRSVMRLSFPASGSWPRPLRACGTLLPGAVGSFHDEDPVRWLHFIRVCGREASGSPPGYEFVSVLPLDDMGHIFQSFRRGLCAPTFQEPSDRLRDGLIPPGPRGLARLVRARRPGPG